MVSDIEDTINTVTQVVLKTVISTSFLRFQSFYWKL